MNSLLTAGVNWNQAIKVVEQAKYRFAKLIGAEPNEIAVLCSVSDIFSTIASSLSFEKGKNIIVTTDMDFPTAGCMARSGEIWSKGQIYSFSTRSHSFRIL